MFKHDDLKVELQFKNKTEKKSKRNRIKLEIGEISIKSSLLKEYKFQLSYEILLFL